jgi:hypothetical protein
MQILELDKSYEKQFYEFINEQRIVRKLDSAWNNISFIDNTRRIFAAIDEDNKIIQVIAVNDMPVRGVGWIYLDTQLSRKVGIKEGKEVTFALLSFVVKTYEKIGTWGFWWIHAGKLKSHIADWDSRFGAHYIKVFEKYNIMDIATVPAGSVTGVPLYDYILKGPLEKDAIVRFAVAWREHALEINADKDPSIGYT